MNSVPWGLNPLQGTDFQSVSRAEVNRLKKPNGFSTPLNDGTGSGVFAESGGQTGSLSPGVLGSDPDTDPNPDPDPDPEKKQVVKHLNMFYPRRG